MDKFPQTCSNKVDFPIPGSPPRRITLPLTIPPPKTLSNSSREDENLEGSLTSDMVTGFSYLSRLLSPDPGSFSLSMVPQFPHAGHLPVHVEDLYPHSEHT